MEPEVLPKILALFLMSLCHYSEGGNAGGTGVQRTCPAGWGLDVYDMCNPCEWDTYSDEDSDACIECPLDELGIPMITKDRASTSIHDCFREPAILDFQPNFGPVAGGTNITLYIANMDNMTVAQVTVADTRPLYPGQDIQETSPSPGTYFVTSPDSSRVQNNTIYVQVVNVLTGYKHDITSQASYRYLPDPEVTNVSRDSTIISGGLEFAVMGRHLTSVAEPRAVITVESIQRPNEVFYGDCSPESSTQMTCTYPDLTGVADMISDVLETSTTPTLAPSANQTREDPNKHAPAVPLRRRRRRRGAAVGDDVIFYLGFEFDAVKAYKKYTQLKVFRDPEFYRFEEENNIKVFNHDLQATISIKGARINHVLTKDDIEVEVGGASCDINFVFTNEIKCTPPTTKPAFGEIGEGPSGTVTVLVHYGRQTHVIGHLNYAPVGGFSLVTILIIVAVGVAMLLVVITWCACFCWCRKRRKAQRDAEAAKMGKDNSYQDLQKVKNGTPNSQYLHMMSNGSANGKKPNILEKVSDCLISHKNVTIGDVIGKGQFGLVFKGQLKNKHKKKNVDVAIKTVHSDENPETVSEFLDEALVMKGFAHKNVVQMYGVTVKDEKPYVVLEYMDHGDLKTYISDPKVQLLTSDLLRFAIQIAEGMAYLSGNRFVHRDLAARNCMINSVKVIKIADFGLSRDIYVSDYYRAETMHRPLPVRWMALESMETGVFNTKSDVWSYGIVLWELFTRGGKPYADVSNYQLKSYLQLGKRLDRPQHCQPSVYEIMESCWKESTIMRPNFKELVTKMTELLKKFISNKKTVDATVRGHLDDGYITPIL